MMGGFEAAEKHVWKMLEHIFRYGLLVRLFAQQSACCILSTTGAVLIWVVRPGDLRRRGASTLRSCIACPDNGPPLDALGARDLV